MTPVTGKVGEGVVPGGQLTQCQVQGFGIDRLAESQPDPPGADGSWRVRTATAAEIRSSWGIAVLVCGEEAGEEVGEVVQVLGW